MKELKPDVEQVIDVICAMGCDAVTAYINSLKRGESRPEYRMLSEAGRDSLLRELQSIMAVYEQEQ